MSRLSDILGRASSDHHSLSGTYVDASGVSLLSGGGTLVLETHDSVRVAAMQTRNVAEVLSSDLWTRRTGPHDGQ